MPHAPELITEEEKVKVNGLIAENKWKQALSLVESGLKGFGAKDRACRKLYMAEICYRSKEPIMADAIIHFLVDEMSKEQVARWDVLFSHEVYSLGRKISLHLAAQPKRLPEEIEAYNQKSKWYEQQLMGIDPLNYLSVL